MCARVCACVCVYREDDFRSGSPQPSPSNSTLLRASLYEQGMKELSLPQQSLRAAERKQRMDLKVPAEFASAIKTNISLDTLSAKKQMNTFNK